MGTSCSARMPVQIISSSVILVFSLVVAPVLCQTTNSTTSSSNAYCFRFTWLGPEYDSSADITGATCTDLLNTYTDTPCTRPLIATNNGYLPDTNKLWELYKHDPTDIACRLTPGNVCVKYVNRYNSQYLNITYTCSKVTILGEGPTTSGCFSQKIDGYEVEVCACRSRNGDRPCNSTTALHRGLLVQWPLSWLIALFIGTRIKFSF